MKRIFVILLTFVLLLGICPMSALAETGGSGNVDGGGGDMGQGTSQNSWNPGMDGVRITVVDAESGQPVSSSFDLTNKTPSIKIHFGKVSKIQYANGASISPTTGNYDYYTPATPMPRIVSSGSQNASIEAIKKYFCSEYAVKLVAQQTGIAYEELIGGQYKLFLEPIAYFKHNGIMMAMTAHEAALYDNQAGGSLRKTMTSLTHKNLPLAMFLEYADMGFPAYTGATNKTCSNDTIITYPDIPAVYVDTGLEYPELRDFVKTKDNVIWLRPRYPFTQILEKYGYPIISKEVSDVINGARKGQPYRLARLNGELLDKNGKKSIYNCENYKYLLDAPFKISARCCYHMKKAPLNKFERQSGRHPITGVLACESKLREQSWIKFGCNGFERQRPLSQPLAFWLEEDILRYLKMTGIPYAPIYGDIVESRKKNGTPILKTTGVSRSGCMYCMYGVHLEHEPNRFQLMQVTHPQQYDYCINKLGCGAVLDYIGVPYRNQQLEVDHC